MDSRLARLGLAAALLFGIVAALLLR